MLRELFLFVFLFVIFPFVHASSLHQKILKNYASPISVYIYSCLLTTALNCLFLAGEYTFLPKSHDALYLGSIIGMNALLFFLFSRTSLKSFATELLVEIQRNWILKLPIILSFITLSYAIVLIRPFGSDILDYYQIGKLFYQQKALIYQGTVVSDTNAFSAHVFHPPFFTLLLSLGHLIQGSAEYFRVNNYISAYLSIMLLSMMLVLMRKKYPLGFCILILGLLTSNYAFHVFILPNGLDAFRFNYFLLAFALLNVRIAARAASTLILFSLSLATCLAVHSSGLLFSFLMLIIYLASYVENHAIKKYAGALVILCIAVCLGGIQYIVNIYHIGKPISDSLPIWDYFDYQNYMRFERNLFSLKHMIFVILKQFLSFDKSAYGYFFFIALCALILNFKYYLLELKQAFLNFFSVKQKTLHTYSEHFLFILGFYSVVFISIVANQELIVKNYRYMLTVYPSIILFVYSVLERASKEKLLQWKDKIIANFLTLLRKSISAFNCISYPSFAFLILGVWFSGLLFKHMKSSYGIYSFSPTAFYEQSKNKNLNHLMPGMGDMVQYIERHIRSPQSILAFDNAQLYQFFPHLKIYTHLDDRLLSLYQIERPEDLYYALKNQHIEGIFVSYYRPSILMQSQFSKLLADPKYVTLSAHKGNYFLYKLNQSLQEEKTPKQINNLTRSINAGTSEIIEINIDKKKQYLIKLTPQKYSTFYQIAAHTIHHPIAYYTYNGESEFVFSTADIEKEPDDRLTLTIYSKDTPLTLDINICELS